MRDALKGLIQRYSPEIPQKAMALLPGGFFWVKLGIEF
jgi:hypothetical protein